MSKSDRTSAIFLVLLSIFVCQQSVVIGLGTIRQPGAGFLSFGSGGLIGILAFWLLIQSIVSKKTPSEAVYDEVAIKKGKFLVICLSLFGYAIVANWLGFVLSTFIFVLFVLRIIEPERWWRTVMKAILIVIGNYVIFEVWLGLYLPRGFWAR